MFSKENFKKGQAIFIICGPIIKKGTIYTIPISRNLFIDPLSLCGRKLCHSCEPNCGIKNRTEVVAMRDVKKDDEITIDYAMIVLKYGDEITAENRVCGCGSEKCRSKLGAYSELSEELKEKYRGFISDYLLE